MLLEVCAIFIHLRTGITQTGIMANSEDHDEMLHKAAFHQSMHCKLRQTRSPEKAIYIFENIFCNHARYTMDHLDLTVSTFMEKVYCSLKS